MENQVRPWCCETEKQLINCLNRQTPIVLLLCDMEGKFSPSCQSRSWNVWAPHPGPPALCPSPAAECFSSTFYCLNSNISLLYLDAEHLLEQVTLCFLVLTFLIEATRQQWSVPKPVGMASEGGKPGGWGCVLRDPAISQTFESTCDVSVWARG